MQRDEIPRDEPLYIGDTLLVFIQYSHTVGWAKEMVSRLKILHQQPPKCLLWKILWNTQPKLE